MMRFPSLPLALSTVLLVACGGTDDPAAGGATASTTTTAATTTSSTGAGGAGGASTSTGGSGGAGGVDSAGGAGGAGGASNGAGGGQQQALTPPHLDELMKMGGALHVMWTNVQPDCDTVRIERKTDADDWAEKFSVPGTVDNKMDGLATADVLYTYRVRCEKAGAFSDYSNELSKNPTK
jgi:hypothetical protein